MKITKNADEDDLEELRDGELFKIISQANELSKKAFDVFYRRYKHDFYKKVCKIAFDENVVKEIFQEAIIFVYDNPLKFKAEEGLSLPAERGRTLNWLAKIAKNIYIEKFRKQKKLPKMDSLEPDNQTNETKSVVKKLSEYGLITNANLNHVNREIEDRALGINASAEDQISLEKRIVVQVVAGLSERDRDILKAYLLEKDSNNKNQKFSRQVLKELREKHKITSAYIRQLKERIFKKVENECLSQKSKMAGSKL